MRDLLNNVHLVPVMPPKAAVTDNTAFVGAIVDRAGFGSLLFAIITGTNADADATYTVLIEDGDAANLSDAAAVADDDLIVLEAAAAFTFADDGECRKIAYIGPKRYVRITITPANNTGNAFVACIAVLGHADLRPTTSLT